MTANRLYQLLPVIHRLRDAGRGEPLRALLQIITGQADEVGEQIARAYQDWFIETCADEVVPLIGALVGNPSTSRRDVVNTIRSRRRRGTLALLEELSEWPARAVTLHTLLGVTQPVRLGARPFARTLDLRDMEALDRVDGPFDTVAHTAGRRFTIGAVGLFVWRLRPYSITETAAFCVDRASNHYTFSILGNDTPLVADPVTEPSASHIADETNVPAFISRRDLDARPADYYGTSLRLWSGTGSKKQFIPLSRIVAADLSGWGYRPRGDQVAIDPELGRIAFSSRRAPDEGITVTYHYAFPADCGGGEYVRPLPPDDRTVYQVGPRHHPTIMKAVEKWRREGPATAIIEITDSGTYEERVDITLPAGRRLELRAAQRTRPVIHVPDRYGRPDSLRVRGDTGARLVIDGLLVAGRGVRVTGRLVRFDLRHCTLVPGWSISGADCEPADGGEPSLELDHTTAAVTVSHSILGAIRVNTDTVAHDPAPLVLRDSILDATAAAYHALSAAAGEPAHVVASFLRTTVFGKVCAESIDLAEDSIFTADVQVSHVQSGCLRFCHVPAGSHTPRRHACQPDGVLAVPGADRDAETRRVRPQFDSIRYGTPAYARLARQCPPEITTGASDDSEMGAYHDLFQPQREATLRARLAEFTPAGAAADLIFVT
ncbi:hypothetical protein [Jidongwangia harbinensis]|uniref:hypothetical protein n=1 Tax=Jidongwangia harbinensis TaxID=2878561 RepID=UPI001CD96A4F|nr:hypothetical protein [Jidongwangia harbinensis]MCA2218024.1 hypothetical protein [Jidongwangia harbinensis]